MLPLKQPDKLDKLALRASYSVFIWEKLWIQSGNLDIDSIHNKIWKIIFKIMIHLRKQKAPEYILKCWMSVSKYVVDSCSKVGWMYCKWFLSVSGGPVWKTCQTCLWWEGLWSWNQQYYSVGWREKDTGLWEWRASPWEDMWVTEAAYVQPFYLLLVTFYQIALHFIFCQHSCCTRKQNVPASWLDLDKNTKLYFLMSDPCVPLCPDGVPGSD